MLFIREKLFNNISVWQENTLHVTFLNIGWDTTFRNKLSFSQAIYIMFKYKPTCYYLTELNQLTGVDIVNKVNTWPYTNDCQSWYNQHWHCLIFTVDFRIGTYKITSVYNYKWDNTYLQSCRVKIKDTLFHFLNYIPIGDSTQRLRVSSFRNNMILSHNDKHILLFKHIGF